MQMLFSIFYMTVVARLRCLFVLVSKNNLNTTINGINVNRPTQGTTSRVKRETVVEYKPKN